MVRDLQLVSRRRPHGNGSTGAGDLGVRVWSLRLTSLKVWLSKVLGMSFAGCWNSDEAACMATKGLGYDRSSKTFLIGRVWTDVSSSLVFGSFYKMP